MFDKAKSWARAESDALLYQNTEAEELAAARALRGGVEAVLTYADAALSYAATFGYYHTVAYQVGALAEKRAKLAELPATYEEPGIYLFAQAVAYAAQCTKQAARRARREQLRVILYPEQHA